MLTYSDNRHHKDLYACANESRKQLLSLRRSEDVTMNQLPARLLHGVFLWCREGNNGKEITLLLSLLVGYCIWKNNLCIYCRIACKHAFRFLRVFPEAVSTRHSWLWQTLDDVYTRRCFAESEGTRFGAPGQKALPSVNEFTLLWIFA